MTMDSLRPASPHVDSSAFVAPGAHIYGDVVIGPEAVIMFGAVLRAEMDRVSVGARSNVQDNCVLHSDHGVPCTVGNETTVGHGAIVHGATVGDHCLIGIGARVLNRAVVGEGVWVAAGSLVAEGKVIPPWTLAVGTPARPLRDLTDDEVARQRSGVADYLALAAAYRQGIFGRDR
jgi:carbonic anhydrase/acetyltransferase-like protein (isoleucine patch superfamily)